MLKLKFVVKYQRVRFYLEVGWGGIWGLEQEQGSNTRQHLSHTPATVQLWLQTQSLSVQLFCSLFRALTLTGSEETSDPITAQHPDWSSTGSERMTKRASLTLWSQGSISENSLSPQARITPGPAIQPNLPHLQQLGFWDPFLKDPLTNTAE